MKNKKFEIKNLLGNSQKRTYRREVVRYFVGGVAWCLFLITFLVMVLIRSNEKTSPKPLGSTIDNNMIVEAVEKKPICKDVIGCIRDVGEELGFSNKDILIAINISRAESGFRADAIGVNKNGSIDRGAMQINSIHKRLSNEDAFNYEKNIRFAYQLRAEQGNWNAWSTCHNGKVDCN